MDEETVRARTVHIERKQREDDMIASAIVSEAVDLEVRPSIACSYGKRIEASCEHTYSMQRCHGHVCSPNAQCTWSGSDMRLLVMKRGRVCVCSPAVILVRNEFCFYMRGCNDHSNTKHNASGHAHTTV